MAIELGSSIILTGFEDLQGGEMIILKKMLGNYVKEFTDKNEKFEKLTLNLNKSALGEKDVFHIQAEMHADEKKNTEMRDGNLFFAIDKCLKEF